ncbi:GNAT family N-acetyltransferase [Stutzerimonas kirkiae]|uniref:GNAT family N-acetyltransferase n=1 Tax=Stutzerimonas kirkiae TaxID=2211392 RepID=A0A4Q9R7I9_9GAMM|nr:GNAT family N-acetyltransferase [Stutzerimonas kirkiae]TBU95986.1 GNAT family N-acetyltransferase [Stutzerimonas kirkiae]TBV03183.1 GNAT family N-acetyltransferase [Stutzerimonas kirkiae]TBV09734.1 GNAT family N-acetyltransferase [Stutzerimonas kirkiae]TBV13536.1 GNAT family N-acetyltransferase [Stutzerimonas kirkiae]
MSAAVRILDSAHAREARSLLYQAYLYEPTFAYLFESARPGYERRLRATVRALVSQHFAQQQPAIGLLLEDRLIAVALIAPPQRRLAITESWLWRLRMLLYAGLGSTRRYIDYQRTLLASLPPGPFHVLPLIGVHPQYQGQQYGEQLLQAVHEWCVEDKQSQGLVIDTGNPHYLDYFREQGYEELGQIAIGPVLEHVFFHAATRE